MNCSAVKSWLKTERSLNSATDMKPDELIVVGRIVAPHGVRGDLRILPDTDRPEIFKTLKRLKIGGKFYKLLSGRPHKNVYILHVEGVDDRNMAETLIDKIVEVPFSELPERPEGTYYYFQLVGLEVVDEAGSHVGKLKEILETGANNVYGVETPDGKEIYLPAIPSCILKVDLDEGRMTVAMSEWE